MGASSLGSTSTRVDHGSPTGSVVLMSDQVLGWVPQQMLTTCTISTKITLLLLLFMWMVAHRGPSPLCPRPLWSTRDIILSPWSRSITQWARGPRNPKTTKYLETTCLCVAPNCAQNDGIPWIYTPSMIISF